MARGSNLELQAQLVIAHQLNFGDQAKLQTAEGFSIEVNKMLVALMKTI
jgi:four helix bundle protein